MFPFEAFAPVAMIVGLTAVGGWIFTTWLRVKHGYPEITPALRAKIFGLNASRIYAINADEVKKHTRADRIGKERLAYREHPEPHYLTYGPKTRREFLNLLGWNGGSRA